MMEIGNLKQRVAINVVAQVLSQILMGLLGVIILKVITNKLGVANYGVYATIIAFVTTFSILTELGVNAVATREIAKAPEKAKEIISHNLGLRISLSIVMIPVVYGLGFVFYPHASSSFRYGLLLASLYLLFDAIASTSATYFSAKVQNELPATIAVGRQLLFTAFVGAMALVGVSLFGYLTAYVFTTALGAIATLLLLRRRIYVRPSFNLKAWRAVMGMSISVGVLTVLGTLYLKADSILLSIMKGTTAVGIYNVAYSLVNIPLYFSGFLMSALIPSIAVAKDKDLGQIMQKSFHVMAVFAFLLPVFGFVVRKDAVLLVSNGQFVTAAAPFAILALATMFSYFFTIFSFASTALNKHHKMIYVSVCTLLLNVGINLVLIPRDGITGAAWATAISEFVAMILGYGLFRRQTGVHLRIAVIIKPLLAAIVTLGVGLTVYSWLASGNSLVNCALSIPAVGGLYLLLLYLLDGLPPEIKAVVEKVLRATTKRIALVR